MSVLALVLAAQIALRGDTVPPYLAFPEAGLDDPAAYQGYATRLYRDANGNAFQVSLHSRTGRVVDLWADAANESVGFTARDSAGHPAALAWTSAGGAGGGELAVVAESAGRCSVSYTLEAHAPVTMGQFLLGSMREARVSTDS